MGPVALLINSFYSRSVSMDRSGLRIFLCPLLRLYIHAETLAPHASRVSAARGRLSNANY
jgi:hypothetical protein